MDFHQALVSVACPLQRYAIEQLHTERARATAASIPLPQRVIRPPSRSFARTLGAGVAGVRLRMDRDG
jgi:hypothetical protein